VTCIVGPNGCGKSNIVDAITWVLGERGTKSLRVKEMGDVIFHGSDSKKQVNMAEVTMGLQKDEAEYAIRRRIYRDGTNEYYLNGETVRLKDIQDFLLGTGIGLHSYAIVEQGNIEYFTQMKPHERRIVVEETSGITRFEEKKKDAFIRLEEVKTNLERVEDIEREVAISHTKVSEEADRLKTYNSLRTQLHQIDVAILSVGYSRLTKKEAKLQEREEALLNEIETKLQYRKNIIERIAAKEVEINLVDSTARKTEIDIKEKEKDLERILLEITHQEGEIKRLEREGAGLHSEIQILIQKTDNNKMEIETLRKSINDDRNSLESMEQKAQGLEVQREELRRIRERLEKETELERNNLFSVMTRLTELRNSIAERERYLKEREARHTRRAEEERLLKNKLTTSEQSLSRFRLQLESEKTDKIGLDAEEMAFVARIDDMSKEIVQQKTSLEGLKGVKKGKEEIIRQMKTYGTGRDKETKPFTRLINILSVNKETEAVLERFFSQEIEYRVIKEQHPVNLAELVRSHGDDAVFFPPKGLFTMKEGNAEPVLTKVENLSEVFQKIANGEEGIFLTDGIMVDSRGFIRKGKDKAALSISEFQKKMKLESELSELADQIMEGTTKIDKLVAAQKEIDKDFQIIKDKNRSKEASIARLEKEIFEASSYMKTITDRLRDLSATSDIADQTRDEWSDEEVSVQKSSCEADKARIEQRLFDLKDSLEEAKEHYSVLDSEYHEIAVILERQRNQLIKNQEDAARKEAAIENYHKEKEQKEKKKDHITAELENVRTLAIRSEEHHSSVKKECATSIARYEETKSIFGNLHMEKSSLNEESQAAIQELEKVRTKKEAVSRERLVLEEKKEAIVNRLRTDYNVENVNEVVVDVEPDESEREKVLAELSTLGEVNFRAEKERADLKERLDFLSGQKSDLFQAMESLKKTISKIDSVSRELFLETFDRVNDAFQRFTKTLFKGGHGHLMLNQDTNGIELYVQPPGKKVVRMELLSGGEKALISLSFLLSLMDTKASPFTLMDEIDAPLDDANLVSLLDIIRFISNKTQVVLITHNRITMESSSTIYGITMEEAGISKTISIRL
jgi:chromosome segregation protein